MRVKETVAACLKRLNPMNRHLGDGDHGDDDGDDSDDGDDDDDEQAPGSWITGSVSTWMQHHHHHHHHPMNRHRGARRCSVGW